MTKKPNRTQEQQEYRDNLARKLKETRKGNGLPPHLTSRDLAQSLLEDEQLSSEYLESLGEGRSPQKHILKQIEKGRGYAVAENLEKYKGLDHKEIADKLIEKGDGHRLVENLEKFKGLDHKEIADKLIEKGGGYRLVEYLEKFKGLDHKEISKKLLLKEVLRPGFVVRYVAQNIKNFEVLDNGWVNQMINGGYGGVVARNIEKFEGVNYQEIADRLIELGEGGAVAYSIKKFQGLNHQDIVHKLLNKGKKEAVAVAFNIEKFEGVDEKEVANKLIELGEERAIIYQLKNFKRLDKEIAEKLEKAGYGDVIANYPEKFGEEGEIITKSFIKLDKETAEKLNREIKKALNNLGKSRGSTETSKNLNYPKEGLKSSLKNLAMAGIVATTVIGMSGCDNSNKENIGTDEPEIEAIKIKEEADSIKKEKEKTDSIKAKEKTDSIWAEYETEMSTKENQMKRLEIAVQNQVPQSRFISVDVGGNRTVLVDKRMRTMYLIIHEGGINTPHRSGYMSILVDSLGKPILYNGPLPD